MTFVLHVRKCSTPLMGLYTRASTCMVLHRKRTVPTQNLTSVTRTANQKRNCLLISDLHNDKQAIIFYKNKANIFFQPHTNTYTPLWFKNVFKDFLPVKPPDSGHLLLTAVFFFHLLNLVVDMHERKNLLFGILWGCVHFISQRAISSRQEGARAWLSAL